MATLHEITRASVDALASSSIAEMAPPSDLAERVRRRRAARAALAGATAVATAAVLVGAALAWDRRGDTEDLAVPSPDPTAGVVALPVTTDTLWSSPDYPYLLHCGEPLPAPHTEAQGFALAATPSPPREQDATDVLPTWRAELTYGGARRSVVVEPGVPVVARDGVVVGVGYPSSEPEGLSVIGNGRRVIQRSVGDGAVYAVRWCGKEQVPDDADSALVEAGQYEVTWLTRVHMTPADAALTKLASEGYAVAASDPEYPAGMPVEQRWVYTWSPGSVDCLRVASVLADGAVGPGQHLPVQCTSDLPEGVSVDPDTGQVSAPYDAGLVGDPVDVTLVSEPFAIRVDQPIRWSDLGWHGRDALPEVAVEPQCGQNAAALQTPRTTGFQTTRDTGARDLARGIRVPLLVDFLPLENDGDATVVLPDGAEVWVAYGAPSSETGAPDWVARGTARFSPTTTETHRATGYPEVDFWIEGVAACDGSSSFDANQVGAGAWFYIDGSASATWDSGRSNHYDGVWIELPLS